MKAIAARSSECAAIYKLKFIKFLKNRRGKMHL